MDDDEENLIDKKDIEEVQETYYDKSGNKFKRKVSIIKDENFEKLHYNKNNEIGDLNKLENKLKNEASKIKDENSKIFNDNNNMEDDNINLKNEIFKEKSVINNTEE